MGIVASHDCVIFLSILHISPHHHPPKPSTLQHSSLGPLGPPRSELSRTYGRQNSEGLFGIFAYGKAKPFVIINFEIPTGGGV